MIPYGIVIDLNLAIRYDMIPHGSTSIMSATPSSTVRSAVDLARAAARAGQPQSPSTPNAAVTYETRREPPATKSGYALFLGADKLTALDALRDAGEALQPAVKLSDLKKRSTLALLSREGVNVDIPPGDFQPQGSYAQHTMVRVARPARGDSVTIASALTLGGVIREAREKRELSQQQLAEEAGVGRRFVSELENGKATLEFDKVLKVAAAAGVSLVAQTTP